jgi:phosphocarrier protein HPr
MTDAASASPLFQDVLIVNKKGLHARASAKFVQCAERFDATVSVAKDLSSVGGTSIMGLMMLSAGHGATIRITAEGAEAAVALAALVELVSGKFGEEE